MEGSTAESNVKLEPQVKINNANQGVSAHKKVRRKMSSSEDFSSNSSYHPYVADEEEKHLPQEELSKIYKRVKNHLLGNP